MSHPAEPAWLTVAESAKYLRVTERTVRNYVARGVLTAHKVEGSRLVRISAGELRTVLAPVQAGSEDAADRREFYVRRLVDEAPPLTSSQRDRLAALLRPGVTTVGGALNEAS